MLPSIDSYLHEEIESKLKIILSNRYIIEDILKGIQPSIANSFMKAYAGENGKEIPIVYTMPQEKEQQRGAIYIGLREGEENAPSLGNVEATYDFKEGNLYREPVLIQASPEEDRLFFEVEHPIGELLNVENLAFAASDNVTIEGNRIYFSYDADLVGAGAFTVNYTATSGDEQGMKKGFTALEHYSVLAVSTNMDTVRCLDLIIKAILILMRSNPQELTHMLLQKLQFGQVQEINVGTEETPELLYGRETIVSYTVSYSLDAPILGTLEEILLNIKFK